MKPGFVTRRFTTLLLITPLILAGCVTTKDARLGDKADPEQARAKYTELGLRYIQQGDTVKARKPLSRALEIAPKSPDVHNALAILFQTEKEEGLADEHFLKALKYGPKRTRIRNNYAAFLFSRQRFEQACSQLEMAANDSLYDFRSSVYENLGVCYQKLNQTDAALAAFDRAIYINNSQARALIEAADIYYDRGNFDVSRKYHRSYQQLVRLRSAANTPKNLWLGIRIARDEGDKNREASYTLMLKNLFPNSREYQLLEASGAK